MSEEWRPIPGSKCAASNLGRIRGLKGQATFGGRDGNGYKTFWLNIDGKNRYYKVHRLVMLAFYGPSTLEVNHKNGVKDDNRLENLEYCTRRENHLHAIDYGLTQQRGSRSNLAKLTEEQVEEVLTLMAHMKAKEVAERLGVTSRLINIIRKRQAWPHVHEKLDKKKGAQRGEG